MKKFAVSILFSWLGLINISSATLMGDHRGTSISAYDWHSPQILSERTSGGEDDRHDDDEHKDDRYGDDDRDDHYETRIKSVPEVDSLMLLGLGLLLVGFVFHRRK